jgi:capsular polysaccharide biosynthesis protein
VEFVPILRTLWRRRILVLLGALAAVALGVMAAGGETTRSGTASTRVVVDTEKSELIYQNPSGHDTLRWRADLLADLLASGPLREQVATQAGIRAKELAVVLPPLAVPVVPSTLPSRASKVANSVLDKYILTVHVDDVAPIISIEAAAPSRRAAARLAGAASATLQKTGTPAQVTRGIQGLAIESAGPVQSKEIVKKPKLVLGFALVVCLFCAWCGAIALGPRLLEAWRGVAERPQAA